MPPRKNIVKSGNAGNSKAEKKPEKDAASTSVQGKTDPPLFPPGFKWPLSLLNERCQKLGWDKPNVETRSAGSKGFSFSVTLSRADPQSASDRLRVRLEPHPPYFRPTAVEAKHWGATYALFRVRDDNSSLKVLPPGPREYWADLLEEQKKAPEHQKWMYEADPFLARQAVDDRQAQAAKKKAEPEASDQATRRDHLPASDPASPFASAPEVRMALSMREMVEDTIKRGIALHPETADSAPLALAENSIGDLETQLEKLGFQPCDIKDATSYLSTPSKLTSTLLSAANPLQACVEYLLLHVPECDLPERFLPSNNSSNPFIVSAHAGEDDLKTRWLRDKAVKEAGYPSSSVKELTSHPEYKERWDLLVAALGRKLIGADNQPIAPSEDEAVFSIDPDEYEALGGHVEGDDHLVLPLFSAPIQIHICFSAQESLPRATCLPIYLTSSVVPAYVRLHLLSQAFQDLSNNPFLESGEGFCMTVLQSIEAAWASVEDNGRPDISEVLQYLVPRKEEESQQGPEGNDALTSTRNTQKKRHRPQGARTKIDFESLRKTDEYKKMLAIRQKLPAYKAAREFISLLNQNRVVVVVGDTVPQIILDDMIAADADQFANIIVTQPRRISAISVAARVAQERVDDGTVGYAIRGESKQNPNTRILFCTTGVVLRRLSVGDSLEGVSHVVVDEVHERSVDGDFLLLELKELLSTHPKLKVVLMSATINHEIFSKYFGDAPVLTIPGFAHPVEDTYLEDVIQMTGYRPANPHKLTKEEKEKTKGLEAKHRQQGIDPAHIPAILSVERSDRIDYHLIATLVNHIIEKAPTRGGILIFLPGVGEIRQCVDMVKSATGGQDVLILPLHANLSNDEQRKVFLPTRSWKVIAATNVAETSITIDDVIYVIDSGKVKETQYDPTSSLTRLVETRVTKAAAKQRRGRAGRTQPGICYKLFTREQERNMKAFPIPEILRVPLESIIISVKAAREHEDVKAFLGRAIDPPSIDAIDAAWDILEELGALDDTGHLTALGKHMSMLPMDVRLAKMLVLGVIFRCLEPIVTIVAMLSSKPLFLNPMDKREEAAAARRRFVQGNSDVLTDLKAFEECSAIKSQGALRIFCEENFISFTTVREVASLRQDLSSNLAEMDLIEPGSTAKSPSLNTGSANLNLIKGIMLGGLWPRVARVHLPDSAVKFDKVSAGTVRRDNIAKDFKLLDLQAGRVFLHPGSTLFHQAAWKSPFVVYFQKQMTSKVFLRDATEVPMYALLLFGGTVSVNHIFGGLTIGNKYATIKLRAIPRIGILVNQLRRLLDAELQSLIDDGTKLDGTNKNIATDAMMALLANDGMSSS